ncbi:MAG TPA: M1 family aminopeptidase [Roseiflexaceae bacterium]
MRRVPWLILLAFLLCFCAEPTVISSPTPTTDDRRPTTDDRRPTTDDRRPTTLPPTSVPPTETPTRAPPTETPTSVPPTETPPTARLNPQDQAAALLPDLRGDLDRAGEWNSYTISATIDPAVRTITGHERFEYTNRDSAALDRLYFHLYPNLPDLAGRLDVGALAVDGQAVPVVYELRRYLLRVDLPRPLAPGASTVVTLDFATRAPLNASNMYGAFNEEDGILALASSYPIAAIVRGGAWDIGWPDGKGDFVNSETALYDVTLTAPSDWKLVTTGVVIGGQQNNGRRSDRIVSGPQRDFMISAVQFGQVSADVDGTHVNSYYRPGDESGGQAALAAASNALRTYNTRYGRYPLAELDVVEVNARTFLGVEYPGLLMIEHKLYAEPGGLEITVAHEVGHQWWYSLVGNDVQTEAWLDEALASYSQIVYQEQVHGPEAAERELEGFRQRYRDAVAAGRDAPVEQPTAAFQGNYVALVYGKAVLFFQALREQIGEAAFDRFLHDYYAKHRYGFVTGAELLADAEGACACDVHKLYADWITGVVAVDVP